MLFKTISIFAIATVGLAPLQAKAASSCSLASHYGIGDGYHGRMAANGEIYNAYGLSAAHRSLPFGTKVNVINQDNGRSVVVKINDRGPYVAGRTLDLSYGAFSKIASPGQGVARVCYSVI
jgi:rare lipoprotein A